MCMYLPEPVTLQSWILLLFWHLLSCYIYGTDLSFIHKKWNSSNILHSYQQLSDVATHTHLPSLGHSCLCWTWTAKRELRSQICGWSNGQLLAVTLLSSPNRCQYSALSKCYQTNIYKVHCCPFTSQRYLTLFCSAFFPSPPAKGADTVAAACHQSCCQMLVTPLRLFWN